MRKHILFVVLATMWAVVAQGQHALFYGSERLNSSLITALAQDGDGLLWVGTEQGLSCFDGYRFVMQPLVEGTGNESECDVTSLLSDKEGHLWVGMTTGLLLREVATGAYRRVKFPDDIKPRITALVETDKGLLAGTAGYGLYRISPDSLSATPLQGYAPEGMNNYFSRLFLASDGSLWKAGTNNMVCCRKPNGKLLTRKEDCQPETFFEKDGEVMAIGQPFTCSAKDGQGDVYLGTRSNGLFRISSEEDEPRRYKVNIEDLNVERARISALLIDKAGNLWVGCYGRGLLMVPLQDSGLFHMWSFARQGRATGSYVTSIAEGDSGLTWCVVQGDGVYGFDKDGHIVSNPNTPDDAECLYRDGNGDFFLGTGNGLFRFFPKEGRWQQMMQSDGYRVNTMTDLGKEQLAVSTFGTGFTVLDKRNGQVVAKESMHDTDTVKRGRLCNDWIFTMSCDNNGVMWVGTSSGICCYKPAIRSFMNKGKRVIRDNEGCTALLQTADGKMFYSNDLTTTGGICFMTQDKAGELWIATTNALYRMETGKKALGEPIIASEFVQGAGLQTTDGRIMLGMADGILVFHPDSIKERQPSVERIHLTAFRIGGVAANTLTESGGKRVMESPVNECHSFTMAYSESNFQLDFSLLDFVNVANTSFEYRMQGDQQWQQTARGENSIIFNHLSPGTYRLQVRGLCSGVRTQIEEYVLEIRNPWWTSRLAYAIYMLLAVLGALALAILYRRHVQHQMNEEKLRFLISAIHNDDQPLSLEEMRKAINGFVQSRKKQRDLYGNTAVMADRMETPEVKGNDEVLMDRIIQSVNKHLSDSEYSIEQLCSEAGISRAQLHRKMKELTGVSTSEFIRGIRLEQAARLLHEQKLNITQVAYTVGFSTAAHFSTVFKKHFGVSPSDYIEQKKRE